MDAEVDGREYDSLLPASRTATKDDVGVREVEEVSRHSETLPTEGWGRVFIGAAGGKRGSAAGKASND